MSLQILIDSFDIKSYNNKNNIHLINDFIKKYEIIRDNDIKKPVFTTTQKYNRYKARTQEFKKNKENKNIWKPLSHENDIKRVESKIKCNLNKINDDVYKPVLKDLKKTLLEINNICILEYFIKIIYDKIIFDKKFQLKYINILNEISNNYKLYENYIDIFSKNKNIYYNICGDKKNINGPFKNKNEALEHSFAFLNLNKMFILKLQTEFKKRYTYIEQIEKEKDDETRYKLKQRYIGIFEVLVILFKNKQILLDTILIITKKILLFKNINYDIECLHILITKINIENKNKNKFENIKIKIESLDFKLLTSRIKFLCYDIKDIL
tara:strand:+ start:1118 stop:2089 length:972 start_codon:yes stop_codon:yes gene_type:complete